MAAADFLDFVRCCRRRESNEFGTDYGSQPMRVLSRPNEETGLCDGLNCRASHDSEPAFMYVGPNGYMPENVGMQPGLDAHYQYVGHPVNEKLMSPHEGNGAASQLRIVPAQPSHGCRIFACTFLSVLGVSLAGSLLYFGGQLLGPDGNPLSWLQRASPSGSGLSQDSPLRAGSFVCTGSVSAWSEAQRRACCTEAGVGCETDTAQAAYDCREGPGNLGQVAWTLAQREWCCSHKQVGCARSPQQQLAGDVHFNCDGPSSGWSTDEKVWCCINMNAGCPKKAFLTKGAHAGVAPSASSRACDVVCQVGGKRATCRRRMEYAVEHRFAGRPNVCSLAHDEVSRHCPACVACAPEGRLCPRPAAAATAAPGAAAAGGARAATTAAPKASADGRSTQPYDCIAGSADREHKWSEDKKAWCCQRGFKAGCPRPTLTRPQGRGSTSSRPPPAATFLLPYDCLAGLSNWKTEWSSGKKDWCCHHSHHGCSSQQASKGQRRQPQTTAAARAPTAAKAAADARGDGGPPYDCVVGYSDWETTWSIIKKAWCCQHKKRGCPPRMTSVPYNCNDGFAKWKTGWTDSKKRWCCRNTGKGCEAPSDADYDCVAGYSKWETGWSDGKKRYCCARIDCRSTV